MTFNYDAGQSRPVGNPYIDGGVRSNGTQKTGLTFDFGLRSGNVDSTKTAWGIERTTSVTPEERVAASTTKTYAAVASVANDADNDRAIDAMLSPYITDETRARIAGTSFTGAMAFEPIELFLSQVTYK